jgi:hypothetical protein
VAGATINGICLSGSPLIETNGTVAFNGNGGAGTIDIVLPDQSSWLASVDANNPWIQITSATGGTGPGSIAYAVDPNPSAANSRTGFLHVNGSTVKVVQGPISGPILVGTWVLVTSKCKTNAAGITCAIQARLTVQNQGTTGSSLSSLAIYLSDNSSLNSSSNAPAYHTSISKLKPGKVQKKTAKLKFPVGFSYSGQYLIGVLSETSSATILDSFVYGPLP